MLSHLVIHSFYSQVSLQFYFIQQHVPAIASLYSFSVCCHQMTSNQEDTSKATELSLGSDTKNNNFKQQTFK